MSTFYREPQNTYYHGACLRRRNELKRRLLHAGQSLQARLPDIESGLRHAPASSPRFRQPVFEILEASLLLSEELNALTDGKFPALYTAHERMERAVRDFLESASPRGRALLGRVLGGPEPMDNPATRIGGKAANLDRIAAAMPGRVPPAFAITSDAYHLFLDSNHIHARIHTLLKDLDVIADRETFNHRTQAIRALIEQAPVPAEIVDEIKSLAHTACPDGPGTWAVRSSGVGEDGRRTFAGQFDSLLNVPGQDLAHAWRRVIAGRFTDRAVYYRMACGISEAHSPMAVLFMPMVPARSAGVLYTRDPRGGEGRMLINSVWGLAADLMAGRAASDTFLVSRAAPHRILEQAAPLKQKALAPGARGATEHIPVPEQDQSASSLTQDQAQALAALGMVIEALFSIPQDIEWVLDTRGQIRIVQSRRLLVRDMRERAGGRPPQPEELILESGAPVFPGWGEGPVFSPQSPEQIPDTPSGAILVAAEPHPDIFDVLPHLAGLILEGEDPAGLLSARVQELGLPCLFGVQNAAAALAGQGRIILDAEQRRVYSAPGEIQNKPEDRAPGGPGPLHSLVFALSEPEAHEPDQCRSIHDLIRLVNARAAQFDAISGKFRS
jgi:pyruvate,water dikinase